MIMQKSRKCSPFYHRQDSLLLSWDISRRKYMHAIIIIVIIQKSVLKEQAITLKNKRQKYIIIIIATTTIIIIIIKTKINRKDLTDIMSLLLTLRGVRAKCG